jgi:ATP-dependent Lhr-like helicase
LQATRADAAAGLLDIRRLGEMLLRVKGRIMHQRLDRVSPLAIPVMLEIGREPVFGEAQTDILAEAADALIREAMGDEHALAAAAGTRSIDGTAAGAARHG